MSIRDVIIAINQMETDGVIDRYAIGGAVGATFYLEPMATLDVDVFVAFRAFVEEGALDPARFQDIVRRHDLVAAWANFERQFLSETS
jgi:hypothetical protein